MALPSEVFSFFPPSLSLFFFFLQEFSLLGGFTAFLASCSLFPRTLTAVSSYTSHLGICFLQNLTEHSWIICFILNMWMAKLRLRVVKLLD